MSQNLLDQPSARHKHIVHLTIHSFSKSRQRFECDCSVGLSLL